MKYSQCSVINCTAVKHYDQLFLDKQLSCASFLILKMRGRKPEKAQRLNYHSFNRNQRG